MPDGVAIAKLLADLNELARAVRPLNSEILNVLLAQAREEIRKCATEQGEQLSPVSDQKKSPAL
jgi:hypothetical protein